jgi:hypothetical protein
VLLSSSLPVTDLLAPSYASRKSRSHTMRGFLSRSISQSKNNKKNQFRKELKSPRTKKDKKTKKEHRKSKAVPSPRPSSGAGTARRQLKSARVNKSKIDPTPLLDAISCGEGVESIRELLDATPGIELATDEKNWSPMHSVGGVVCVQLALPM